MGDDATMISSSVDFEQDGLQTGSLRLPHSVHRSAYGHIPIPIAVAKNGDGPTVLLTGGIHGDEYEGPIALGNFIRSIEVSRLKGRVIVLPAVNYPAFLAGSRVSPIDEINLNRTFPGRRNGTATEMIAHYLCTVLLPMADYLFDFHAGGSSLQYLPCLLAPRWADDASSERLERLLDAFAVPHVIYFDSIRALSGEDRVIGNYAHQNDAFFLTGEFGGGSSVNLDGLRMISEGLPAALAHLGLLPRNTALPWNRPIRRMAMDDPGLFAFAPCSGVFEPKYRLGDEVAPGSIAGFIHNIEDPWAEPRVVTFKRGGLAVCIRTFALVQPGDCLGHLAADL